MSEDLCLCDWKAGDHNSGRTMQETLSTSGWGIRVTAVSPTGLDGVSVPLLSASTGSVFSCTSWAQLRLEQKWKKPALVGVPAKAAPQSSLTFKG